MAAVIEPVEQTTETLAGPISPLAVADSTPVSVRIAGNTPILRFTLQSPSGRGCTLVWQDGLGYVSE